MQPIFTEMINMWKDLGYELPIEAENFGYIIILYQVLLKIEIL